MPENVSDDDLRKYAALVRNRDQFGAIFDELSHGRTRKFMLVALLNSQEPYLEAFKRAENQNFLEPLLEKLFHAGVMVNSPASQMPDSVSRHLEAITRPDLGFPNVEAEIAGKLTASRRLCCITVLTKTGVVHKSGTGFLVGPQTVLTSYHVISDLLDDNGEAFPDSGQRLRVAFDELNGSGAGALVPVHEMWLAGHSKLHWLEDITSGKPLDWDNAPEDGFDLFVDCALVRLSDTVGRERGYYRLEASRIPEVNNASAQVGLLQHPAGSPLSSTPGANIRLWPKTHKTRVHHNANSAPGSSGGLLVDNEFQPIGLHQCSFKDAANNVLFNGAITTASIAKLNLPMQDVIGFDPIWQLATKEPVIGREQFQKSALDALVGKLRILTVTGERKMGRTFTTKILREIFGTAEHQIAEVSASSLMVMARTTAMTILAAVIGDISKVSELPDTSMAETAQAGWIRAELFPAFARELQRLANHRTVWVVIDDLDRFPIANTSTRVFLETLYAEITSVPALRLVLIGFEGAVPGATSALVEGELLREFNVFELGHYIERESTAHKITRKKGEARNMAQDLLDLEDVRGKLSKADFAKLASRKARRV